jgi:hypothetical protein
MDYRDKEYDQLDDDERQLIEIEASREATRFLDRLKPACRRAAATHIAHQELLNIKRRQVTNELFE